MFTNARAGMAGVLDNVQQTAARGKDSALAKLERANEAAKEGQYKLLGQTLKDFVKEKHNVNMDALKAAGFYITEESGRAYGKMSTEAKKQLFDIAAPMRAKLLMALREVIKQAVVGDPDMSDCLRVRIGRLVDVLWYDVTISVEMAYDDAKQAALGRVENDIEVLGALGEKPTCCSPKWWRAKFLYHFLPYDLSIFGQFKDPLFWLLTGLSMLPYFGLRVVFFLFYLLAVVTCGGPDEFQLVVYVMGLKGTQFLSSGIGMCCFAGIKYYICVRPDCTHTCNINGPGVSISFVEMAVDFVGTCALGWIALWCFPCSVRSAGMRDFVPLDPATGRPLESNRGSGSAAAGESDEEAPPRRRGCCHPERWDTSRGGRLVKLFRYDLICFVLCVLLWFLLRYIDKAHLRPGEHPDFHTDINDVVHSAHVKPSSRIALFWVRTVYALLAFPFTIFFIPGLQGILTHTSFTGYNMNGVCVPYKLRPMPTEKSEDGAEDNAAS